MRFDRLRQRLVDTAAPFLQEGERPEIATLVVVNGQKTSLASTVMMMLLSSGGPSFHRGAVATYLLLTDRRLLLVPQQGSFGRPARSVDAQFPRSALRAGTPTTQGRTSHLTVCAGGEQTLHLAFAGHAQSDAAAIAQALSSPTSMPLQAAVPVPPSPAITPSRLTRTWATFRFGLLCLAAAPVMFAAPTIGDMYGRRFLLGSWIVYATGVMLLLAGLGFAAEGARRHWIELSPRGVAMHVERLGHVQLSWAEIDALVVEPDNVAKQPPIILVLIPSETASLPKEANHDSSYGRRGHRLVNVAELRQGYTGLAAALQAYAGAKGVDLIRDPDRRPSPDQASV